MHQLGDSASTDRADVVRLVSDSIEHMFILVVNRSVATDPDRQPPATGPVRPATDGSVQHVCAHLGEHVMDVANQRRRVSAQIEVDFAWAYPMQQAVLTESDCLYLWRAWQRRENNFASFHRGSRRVDPGSAGLEVRCRSVTVDVMHDELVATLERIECHAGAHGPQTNESNFHVSSL